MTAPKFVQQAVESPTPGSSVSAASGAGLPAEILERASRRLGLAGLLYAGTYFFAYFGPLFSFHGTDLSELTSLPSLVAYISIGLGLAVYFASRHADIRPELLLDLGLIFWVVAAFGISMAQFWGVYPTWSPEILGSYMGIPWECVWILIFPMLAPNSPGKILLASLGAASTGLLAIVLSKAAGLTSPEAPFAVFVPYFLFTTYLCAGLAFVVARIIYGFGKRLKKAQEIGSYQLVDRLGAGGMGEVWVAKHRMLARPAAIKLIRPELLGAEEEKRRTVVRRFEREARATAALRSQHTVELYDFGITADGSFYYVSELLEGMDLESLVNRFGPLPPARAIFLLRQVCHSLGEAHENGLIHRDIKPANIHVCRLGPDFDFVKVLDFGLVKSRADAAATKLTKEGVAAGTPAFIAPEMAMGETRVDGRADIYALGCVAYWSLSGQLVFQADNPLATVVQHVQAKPVPPSQRTEIEIPDSLERVVMSCLEKKPADRPQSAAELDALLAAECVKDGLWGQEQAAEWWRLHMPDSLGPAKAELDVEVSPQEILAVKH